MVPVVHLSNAVAVLGQFPVLAGVNLTVNRGEIVLLQGPNGAGKTSLLRLCAGLLPLARGEAVLLGCDLRTQREAVRSRVGLLGHANGLYADLTVAENVRFWGATVGASKPEVQAALQRMGLAQRLTDVAVSRLSAGQKRRTALACLIARRAELWLTNLTLASTPPLATNSMPPCATPPPPGQPSSWRVTNSSALAHWLPEWSRSSAARFAR